jgi:hypothetical protein
MTAVIDIIANNSYLAEMMKSLGDGAEGMPVDIKKYIGSLKKEEPIANIH